MQGTQVKFTYRDYLQLPEQDRRELIGGDFHVVPSPSVRHQAVSANLGVALRDFVGRNRLGVVLWAPMDAMLSDEDVVQPDILFVSNERRGIIAEDNISGAPDLVVEVLSPGTADRDRELKRGLYARAGVREYWVVDPDQMTIRVLDPDGRGRHRDRTYDSGYARSSVLPGADIPLDTVFADL